MIKNFCSNKYKIFSRSFFNLTFKKLSDDKSSWSKNFQSDDSSGGSNPFFNPHTAALRSQLQAMQESIKEWQGKFKSKNGRPPKLEEMKNDPEIGPILNSLDKQKKEIQKSVQRFRIN
jgi:hypothetical protein